MKNIFLLYNTLKFLKPKQLVYQLWYRIKSKLPIRKCNVITHSVITTMQWKDEIYNLETFKRTNTFSFLNITHDFQSFIDWNYNKHKKLWNYNLNYFEFLNQISMTKKNGLQLIKDYIIFYDNLKDGKESYPTSLRLINWIKFVTKYNINDDSINVKLKEDASRLYSNLEYHLLGNHLLENGFALLFVSYYFQNTKFYNKSKTLLLKQLDEQILNDGGHFELSPMYHSIILNRLLDCINLIKLNNSFKDDELLEFLNIKASIMCSWLKNIIYDSGLVPMVNDSAYKIAIDANKLLVYAVSLGINEIHKQLSDSGYRKVKKSNYELLIDVGNIGADYQPGHAHSDTFNFELHINKLPIIVDTGISTYEKNDIRQLQRSTTSHNTVMIGNCEQSEVWGGFRVARRAKVFDLNISENQISAKHSGYKDLGIIHSRSITYSENEIIIEDNLTKPSNGNAMAMFHFHSDIDSPKIYSNKIILKNKKLVMSFVGHSNISILSYDLCEGFNKTVKAYKLVVNFNKDLKTQINL